MASAPDRRAEDDQHRGEPSTSAFLSTSSITNGPRLAEFPKFMKGVENIFLGYPTPTSLKLSALLHICIMATKSGSSPLANISNSLIAFSSSSSLTILPPRYGDAPCAFQMKG